MDIEKVIPVLKYLYCCNDMIKSKIVECIDYIAIEFERVKEFILGNCNDNYLQKLYKSCIIILSSFTFLSKNGEYSREFSCLGYT